MGRSGLILIVDDCADILLMLRDSLRDEGFLVETASSGEAAIARLKASAGAFHTLITDVELGGRISGWDVASYARAVNPAVAVVYLTGGFDDAPELAVRNSRVLRKPFPLSALRPFCVRAE